MFPGVEATIVLAVVESSDSVEAAIATLLHLCGGDPSAQVDNASPLPTQPTSGIQPAEASSTPQGGVRKQLSKQQPTQPHHQSLSWGQMRGGVPA